ncbi:hypothetical protein BU17DRAFT_65589 [Hysterangium stoloniferum]|nr:hypothetical protein BU17DRAFT_65589 [Hysterangium stoloniferum]
MKFSSALVAVTAVTVVSSHPILSTRKSLPPNCSAQNESAAAGAAYFITNEPDGNFIVGSDIGADGKLTFKHATWAGGRGAHGVTDPIGPDGLFSQGSIKIAGQSVFTVNAGSNTVAMFSIDSKDPAKLRMVGQPVSTGGEFPMSVTISKQSGQVCVLNGGKVNGVNCFKQDPRLGLIQMSDTQRSLNLNQTTPPSGPPGTTSHIIFNEDGTQLLASVKGVPPAGGFIASWAVDPTSGSLSAEFIKSGSPQGGGLPFSMTVIPGKDAILATDPGGGFDIFNFKAGKQASSTAVPITGQIATCWSSFSKATGNFYLTDIGTSQVTEVNVDNNLNGTIVNQYPQGNASSTIDNDIADINGKDFLYVMAPGKQSVMVLSLDAPGKTTPVQQFSFQDAASKAGIKTSTNNLQGMTVFVG